MAANGLSWRIEFLVGSLDCQFSETKPNGAELLQEVLRNNRDLAPAGEAELKRQLATCTSARIPAASDAHLGLPQDIVASLAHFQRPGVSGDMKGGYRYRTVQEPAVAVVPMPAMDLLARRVVLNQPQVALDAALARLPAGATGAIVHGFAVITTDSDRSRSVALGNCLEAYAPPLKNQFDIAPTEYMITVYTGKNTDEIYNYARKLHGIQLPQGVVAYSVVEDMSLAGVAKDSSYCGTLAHEMVHLLIKRKFPVSPAWLEEGLASEVAVATLTPDGSGFSFGRSWRDEMLTQNLGLRPKVVDLLEIPWSKFNASSQMEMPQVTATQAMAAVFVRYLDAMHKLSEVYFAVRDQHLSLDMSKYRSYREIVEEKMGMDISDVDRDFAQWFDRQRSPEPASIRPCVVIQSPAQVAYPCEPNTKKLENSPPTKP